MQRTRRRRITVVDRTLQYRFLALIMIYGLIIVFFLAAFLLLPDLIRLQDESLTMEAKALAADRVLSIHVRIWPAVIILICMLGLHSFRVFHRLIGPLYRFRWVFDKIRAGDLVYPLKIREKDYLHKEESSLNEMILALVEKMEAIQGMGDQAAGSLSALQRAVEGGGLSPDETDALFKTHVRNIETLLKEIRFFRILRSDRPEKASEPDGLNPSNKTA